MSMAKSKAGQFEETVYVAAALRRESAPPNLFGHDSYARSIYISECDGLDCIAAEASCGQEVFVCGMPELPALIRFLQRIVDETKTVKK
jgi:hypothetical protein